MARRMLVTSESVTEGHPDKLADQISDAVLDAVLAGDPVGRVACETMLTTGIVFVAGEISTKTYVDIPGVVRDVVRSCGYNDPHCGFHWETVGVVTAIKEQSPDIAKGVDTGGAGDQGMMYGFACDETPEFMPLPIVLAHALTRRLADVRRSGEIPYLWPDGKSQVTVLYEDGVPRQVTAVVVSAHHQPDHGQEQIRRDILEHVVKPTLGGWYSDDVVVHVNPTGSFVLGGPNADTGLTGRKIIVDTYGGAARHGGGCFSGKDPTKVDRSAAYMARYVAKNILAAGLARRVEVQLAYAIGVAEPVSVAVDTFGTGKVPDERLERAVRETFPLTPRGIIEHLDLRRPIYRATACYGHFGRNEPAFTWERTDKADELKEKV